MAGSKRRELTADDLMRMQEGPRRKRLRLDDTDEEDLDVHDTSSGDEAEVDGHERAHEGGEHWGSGSEEDEEGSSPRSGDESDVSQHAAAPVSISIPQDAENEGADSRFASSRLSFKPRATNPTTLQAPLRAKPLPTTFETMGISSGLVSALAKMSIRSPTQIQAACIPPLLAGRDCIGNAKTGSGKTIAFALPILQKLSLDPYGIFALVLTPTRELAFQISEQFAVLGAPLNLRTAVVVGGVDMMAQALELGHRPHVVVATPGRIVDLLKSTSGEWDLSRVKFLVLDEADRLLTPSFAPELSYLFETLPKERQTCLFTATLTAAVERVADAPPKHGKQKPFIHRMTASVETVETLKQHFILVPSHVREAYLYHLLCNPPESTLHLRRAPPEPTKSSSKQKGGRSKPSKKGKPQKKSADDDEPPEQPPPTIIFCTHPRAAAYLTHLLQTLRIRTTALHSRLTQRERLSSLSLFRASVVPVLVSTDVGARGLDIEDVAIVINWDIPSEPEEYTHRVGRTARAGRGGVAVSFVTERDEERILKVEERIGVKLAEMSLPEGKVLEKLNAVATAKRLANMELHDSDFGKREEIHKIKRAKRAADVQDGSLVAAAP
ncbi:P-loop containing nucleoside triphosphate hydrolase protein [Ganoderma leucocontextum]|nr:P-loop containing nucleoside triphosphate hydrolase protein [Ganoderma leucocontextum]